MSLPSENNASSSSAALPFENDASSSSAALPLEHDASSSSAAVDLEMMEAYAETTQAIADAQPENTKKAYASRIAEYKTWCDKKFATTDAETRYTVYGQKAHLFLKEEVCISNLYVH